MRPELSSMPDGIFLVRLSGIPTQILKAIVCGIAVVVAALCAFRRSPSECQKNQSVYRDTSNLIVNSEIYSQAFSAPLVFFARVNMWLKKLAAQSLEFPTPDNSRIANSAIFRSNLARWMCGIACKPGDWKPLHREIIT